MLDYDTYFLAQQKNPRPVAVMPPQASPEQPDTDRTVAISYSGVRRKPEGETAASRQ